MKTPAVKVKRRLAGTAARITARHTAHGAAAKLTRRPLRAVTLLGIGCAAGALAGWVAARQLPRPQVMQGQ